MAERLTWDEREQDTEERARMVELTRLAARGIARARKKFPRQATMCETCAFRNGTEANRNAMVLELVSGQLLSGGMFYCHAGLPIDERGLIHAPPEELCMGFLGVLDAFSSTRSAPDDA